MGLALLILGLAIFVGVHWFTTMRGHRAALIARVGEGPYKGLYSLVALIGFVLICYGFGQYRATGWIDIWDPPPWTRHVALPLQRDQQVAPLLRGRVAHHERDYRRLGRGRHDERGLAVGERLDRPSQLLHATWSERPPEPRDLARER